MERLPDGEVAAGTWQVAAQSGCPSCVIEHAARVRSGLGPYRV
jgi:hypothetical protein